MNKVHSKSFCLTFGMHFTGMPYALFIRIPSGTVIQYRIPGECFWLMIRTLLFRPEHWFYALVERKGVCFYLVSSLLPEVDSGANASVRDVIFNCFSNSGKESFVCTFTR